MATQTQLGKITGSVDSVVQPVTVWDDAGASMLASDAVAAAVAAAPTTFFGSDQAENATIEKLNDSAYRIGIQYRAQEYRPLSRLGAGEERFGFRFHAPRISRLFAPEIDVFPSGFPSMGGLIDLRREGGGERLAGVVLDPPEANLHKTVGVAPATVTASLVRTLAGLMGHVNTTALQSGAYAIGEIMLVSATGQLVDDDLFNIDFAWSWKENVSGESWGDVTGVEYDGHDFAWPLTKPYVDRDDNLLGWEPRAVYVNRVHPRADLSAIGVLPP